MGLSISIPCTCDLCIHKIFYCLEKKVGYTRNLETNLVALETTIEDLKAKRDDLSRKVTREEDRGLQRLAEFQVWLNRVETVEQKVNHLLSFRDIELQRLSLCGFCSKNLRSSNRYGKNVFLMLREVEELKIRGFEVIVDQAKTPMVDERQLQPTIIGQEKMLEKAWKHLMEDGVGIMGMYGMGGVGKTTLLTQINNKFSNDSCGFDFVIWVVVSKELHVKKIQDEIAKIIGLGGEEWSLKDGSHKAARLYNFLRKKKFVLFLDDIWEKVDLVEIGVPFPTIQNQCKVVFTTRSQDVCARMGAEKPMEVQCLADNDAFDLFQKKVGKTILRSDPGIPELARIIAKKCCGLPLALNVIGETMSCKRTIEEWRHTIDVRNSYAAEFSGMEDNILSLLKYSYDSLAGDHVKSCLLYCSLFPEDDKISKEKIIEYWIGEGIIDGSEGIEKAERKGYDLISSLVSASLLMDGVNDDGKGVVCMHDVVREMALSITSDLGKQKEAFIVRAGTGLYEIPKIKNWNIVRKMSLMHNKIHYLTGSPECLVLTTLLLQSTELKVISSEFFMSMPNLAVLDLSLNGNLFELPEGISNLVSLQYLNLSSTGIRRLPKGLQELRKLIHLDLAETIQLQSIAGISRLHNLKVLKLDRSAIPWDLNTVKELEVLEHLEILTATINRPRGLEKFFSSHRLMSCTRLLTIVYRNPESSGISLPATMKKLRYLSMCWCSISEIKMGRKCSLLSLVKVRIDFCKGLRELTFLMFAPNLRILDVDSVYELEDIINKEKAFEVENSGILPFPKLNKLRLAYLPKLKTIYWSSLPFPCLKRITIEACLNLKKLPLNSESGKHGENGLIITYMENEWIEGVEWEDEATKTRFLSSCEQKDPPYDSDYDSDYDDDY